MNATPVLQISVGQTLWANKVIAKLRKQCNKGKQRRQLPTRVFLWTKHYASKTRWVLEKRGERGRSVRRVFEKHTKQNVGACADEHRTCEVFGKRKVFVERQPSGTGHEKQQNP
jgi:hypothetical protein